MTQKLNLNMKSGLNYFVQGVIWTMIGALLYYSWQYPQELKKIFPGFEVPHIDSARIIHALIFFSAVLYIFRFIKKLILKWVDRHPGNDKSVYYSMVKMNEYLGWAIALWGGLSFLGLDLKNLALIFGALSVGIGFGMQNIVNNFISGILILFERPISVGDWIKIDNQEGIVKNIHIRSTEIETFDKSFVLIPNATILSNEIVNLTQRNRMGRIIIPVGVAYDSDMDKVKRVLLRSLEGINGIDQKKCLPLVLMTEFADNSVNFELRFYIMDAADGLEIKSQVMFRILELFNQEHIEIPFPQRVVYLKKND